MPYLGMQRSAEAGITLGLLECDKVLLSLLPRSLGIGAVIGIEEEIHNALL